MVAFFLGDSMHFRRIADLRVDSDLTQRAVAAHLNMNLEVYRRYDTAVSENPVWYLLKIEEISLNTPDLLQCVSDFPRPPRA